MKKFLKIMIIIMAIVVIAASAFSIFALFDMTAFAKIDEIVSLIQDTMGIKITLITAFGALIILSIVSIIGSDALTNDAKGGVVLTMSTGDVQISPQTFESIVMAVAKKYGSVKTNRVAIKMTDEGVLVDLFVYVLQDTIIADITEKLQKDIKETVLKQTTISVKNVNVKIKGIYELNETKN